MPVVRRGPSNRHPEHDALVDELVRHLKDEPNLPEVPRIIEETVPLSPSIRVYVLWDEWKSVRDVERSEIILEAYDKARGREDMLKISVASGLTPLEAQQLGLSDP